MNPKSSALSGVGGGLLLVVVIIICGAFLGYKGREAPAPVPTLTDRPPVIVNQP